MRQPLTNPLPQVDVVVLTWNDGALLDAALESVRGSTGIQAEAIVVDNGSTPPVPRPSGSRLLRNERNRGVAAGRNQGARAGAADFVCFLDSDARLEPDALAHLVEPLVGDARIALSAPVFVGQRREASAGRAPTLGRKLLRLVGTTGVYVPGSPGEAQSWDVDFAIGACQLVRRTAFEAVGGLDESYFYGPEDVDFCLRLRERGWRVVQVGAATCHHPPRRGNRRLFTVRGMRHAVAVCRHLWRHRGFQRRVKQAP